MHQIGRKNQRYRLTTNYCIVTFVLLFGLLASISLGLSYGIGSTHPTYIIPGIRLADPTFLSGDWWTDNTTHYHIFFPVLIAALYSAGSLPELLAALKIFLDVIAVLAIFGLIRTLYPKQSFVLFALVISAFFFVSRTASLQGSYLFDAYVQPSSLASVGLLLGIWFFARQQYIASGLAMAIGGLFHVNYLILIPVFFGLANLFDFREPRLIFRITAQAAPSLVFVLFFLPSILDVTGFEIAETLRKEMSSFFAKIYAPGHYDPFHSRWQYLQFFSWIILSVPFIRQFSSISAGRRMASLYLATTSIVIGATLLSMLGIDLVTRLFFWRFAPLVILLAQIIFFYGLLGNSLLQKQSLCSLVTSINWTGLVFVAVGCLGLARYYIFMENTAGLVLCGLIGLLIARSFFALRRIKDFTVAGIILVSVGIIASLSINSNSNCRYAILVDSCEPSRFELFEWARDHTNKSARFIVPPRLRAFRLFAERPVFVDWQNIPFRPDEQREWLSRLLTVSGLSVITDLRQPDAAYKKRDPDDLIQLAITLEYEYVILETDQVAEFRITHEAREVFRNSEFSVVKVTSSNNKNDTNLVFDQIDGN